jgi:hypothetical protein
MVFDTQIRDSKEPKITIKAVNHEDGKADEASVE